MDDGIRNCLPSPTGYSFRIGDVNRNGVLAYGSFNNIILVKMMWQPTLLGVCENCHNRVKFVRFNQYNAISPNILASAAEKEVKIWDLEYDGLHLKNEQAFEHVSSIEWSFNLTDVIFVAHSKNIITKWNVMENDKDDMTCGNKTDEIMIITSNPLKPIIAVGFKNGFIALYDIESCRVIQKVFGHQKVPTNISFSRYSNQVLTSSLDGVICVWTIQDDDDDAIGDVCHEWNCSFPDFQGPFAIWHPTKQNVVIATTSCGHVGEVNLNTEGEMKVMNYKNGIRPDNKMINCLFSNHQLHRAIYTFSKDRMLTLWDLEKEMAIAEIHTYKSPIRCAAFPPISTGISGTLAIASMERSVLFWDTTSDPKVFKSKTFYNCINTAVGCLAWHPEEKNKIAFGSEDGSIGIINDWKLKSKPNYSSLKHEDLVVSLCWGPCSKLTDKFLGTSSRLALFSCGKGKILIHFKDKSLNLYEVVQSNERRHFISICWKDDFSMFATGSGDGFMDVYDGNSFELLVEIAVSSAGLSNISWHPTFFLQGGQKIQSSLHSWIAAYFSHCGGTKGEIIAYDIQKDLVDKYEHQKCVQSLFVHSISINCLAWSPYFEEHLAAAASDGIVTIWNMVLGHVLCKFVGHFSSVQTVSWSPVDKGYVFCGSSCSTILSFNQSRLIQDQKKRALFTRKRNPEYHNRRVETKVTIVADSSSESDEESVVTEKDSIVTEKDSVVMEKDSVVTEKDSIVTEKDSVVMEKDSVVTERDLVVMEKDPDPVLTEKDLLITEKDSVVTEELDAANDKSVLMEEVIDVTEELLKDLPVNSNTKTSKKSNRPSEFLSTAFDNLGFEKISEYVRLLDSYLRKKQNNCIDEGAVKLGEGELKYLGVFGDREDVLRMVETEAKDMNDDVSQSDRMYFDLWWKNDLTEHAKCAIANGTITDELFSYSPQVSRSLWREVCFAYAKQLENEGSYYKAVICLLLCHKVKEAINLLKDKNIVDALMLARRYILDENDVLLNEVIESFKQQLLKDKLEPSDESSSI